MSGAQLFRAPARGLALAAALAGSAQAQQLPAVPSPVTRVSLPAAVGQMGVENRAEENTAHPCPTEGGIWQGKTYAFLCLSKEWNAGNTAGATTGPDATVFVYATNNGALGNPVAGVFDMNALTSNSVSTGLNVVARTNGGGLTGVQLDAAEFDCEPAVGDTLAPTSGCIYINEFSSQIPVGIQFGGIFGGSYLNAMIFSAVSGTALGAASGYNANSFLDNTQATSGRINLGQGINLGIDLGGGVFGTSSFLYQDGGNNLVTQLGAANAEQIKRSDGVISTVILGAGGMLAEGSPPTLSGTCSTNTQAGGQAAGTFKATCSGQTVIITFATAAPHGWNCNAHDLTTPADTLAQTAMAASSCTLSGTTAAGDTIAFTAIGQ